MIYYSIDLSNTTGLCILTLIASVFNANLLLGLALRTLSNATDSQPVQDAQWLAVHLDAC